MGRLVRTAKLATIVEPLLVSDFGGMFQSNRAPAPATTAAVAGDDYLTRMATPGRKSQGVTPHARQT
jgi:hypothetical protein